MRGRKEDNPAMRSINLPWRSLAVAICMVLPLFSWAQDTGQGQSSDGKVQALLSTLDKNVEVGRPYRVQLEVQHPADMVVIFPDTGLDFAPFEIFSRDPITTQTEDGSSTDRVIYQLYSWAIDSIQYVTLPVKYIDSGDTSIFYSNTEPLLFIPKIPTLTDSTSFIYTEELAIIDEPIDWTVTGIVVLVLVLVLGGATILLYNPIRNALLRRRIEREWTRYRGQWEKLAGGMQEQETFLLSLSKVWKGYFDRDWGRGLGSLTSKELEVELKEVTSLADEDRKTLVDINRSGDRVTYAGSDLLPESHLKNYYDSAGRIMEREYRRRKEALEI